MINLNLEDEEMKLNIEVHCEQYAYVETDEITNFVKEFIRHKKQTATFWKD